MEHLVIALGVPEPDCRPDPWSTPLVRLHSECLTGDVLGSLRCDCGPQLTESIARIHEVGGYLVYLRQEGRGIGLYNKIDAYALQDDGLDTFEANEALGFGVDERTYGVAAQMLLALGVERVELLTNNPEKADQLSIAGVHVERCLPTALHLTPANGRYLAAKACRGHLLPGLSAG
jgi:GTP cyclohydrolase II